MTVGHHWSGSRPLNDKERTDTDRRLPLSHREIPEESLAVSLLHHTAEYAGMLPASANEHDVLIHKVPMFTAWGQTGGAVLIPLAPLVLCWDGLRRRRQRRDTAAQSDDM